MTKDYYKILDISELSNQEEIKNAYRLLVRKWHPDIAGNSPDIINKFKEINEAYEILSDKNRKADYDTARRFYNYSSTSKEQKYSSDKKTTSPQQEFKKTYHKKETADKKSFSFNWEDFIGKRNKDVNTKKENEIKQGDNINTDIEITVLEAITGTTKTLNMLQTSICPKCKGKKFINGSVCSSCLGKGENSTHKRFSVKIPAGIKNGSKIRLAGEGEKGINGGKNGDLYLTIHIKEPKNYKTEGLNILKTVAISPFEAVLGGHIELNTLQGKISLKIAPNTRNGQKIRLSGCGIMQNNKVGDMIITVEIQIPKTLTNEEINLYKKLKDISSSTIRED